MGSIERFDVGEAWDTCVLCSFPAGPSGYCRAHERQFCPAPDEAKKGAQPADFAALEKEGRRRLRGAALEQRRRAEEAKAAALAPARPPAVKAPAPPAEKKAPPRPVLTERKLSAAQRARVLRVLERIAVPGAVPARVVEAVEAEARVRLHANAARSLVRQVLSARARAVAPGPRPGWKDRPQKAA